MQKTDVAEWILSLTTSFERAASTAGDLAEESGNRGTAWFWISLARTALSVTFRDIISNPLAVIRLAGMTLAYALFLGVVIMVAAVIGGFFLASNLPALGTYRFGIPGYFALLNALQQFLLGAFITRHGRGRELTTYVAFLLVLTISSAVLNLFMGGSGYPSIMPTAESLITNIMQTTALVLGIAYERKHSAKRNQISTSSQ